MKSFSKIVLLGMSLACVMATSSCSDNSPIEVNTEATAAYVPAYVVNDFNTSYPEAQSVSWTVDDEYAVASFVEPQPTQAGTASMAVWYDVTVLSKKMQSRTIDFDELPEAVKEAFLSSEYGTWAHDSTACVITRYEKKVVDEIYALKATGSYEADSEVYEATLYYTPMGVLVKLSLLIKKIESDKRNDVHEYRDWLPHDVPDYVETFVRSQYPSALYLHIYVGKEETTVKILDGRTARTLIFDADGNWLSTCTSIRFNDLPEAVRDAFKASEYANYNLDETEEYITPDSGKYYQLTVKDRSGKKVELRIDESGSFLCDNTDDDNSGSGDNGNDNADNDVLKTHADVEAYLLQRYPNATIRDWGNDDKELEVELTYNGVKIDVRFDRSSQGYVWTSSEWNLDYRDESATPAPIKASIESLYAGYQLYFISFVETAAEGNFYEAGLKSAQLKKDLKVRFDEQGNVLAEYGKH